MTPGLRIGTSGWNYPTGRGTWNGVFYPPARKRPKGFDELAFYASHFDTVEVNSTFYGQPRAERVPRLGRAYAAGLRVLRQAVSEVHASEDVRGARSRLAAGSVGTRRLERPARCARRRSRSRIRPTSTSSAAGSSRSRRRASWARCWRSFLRASRKRRPRATTSRSFSAALTGYHVAVELRHKSWSDRIGETLALLNEFQAAWVQIDEPKFKFSIRQNYLPNVQGFYYMRLHGRNVEQWWRHAKSEDRYDYLYSADELREFSDTADAARRLVKKLYLYTNNHFSAKSVANAAMIKQQLGEPIEGEYPAEFLERYPQLAGVVKPQSSISNQQSSIPLTP